MRAIGAGLKGLYASTLDEEPGGRIADLLAVLASADPSPGVVVQPVSLAEDLSGSLAELPGETLPEFVSH